MKVLFVASCTKGHFAPFITEQIEALKKLGVESESFGVRKKGFWGYIGELRRLKKAISVFNPDVVHAHYGLCGLLANLQRKVPVVTTYHGSDINDPEVLLFSKVSIRLSAFNIFVSQKNIDKVRVDKKFALIPCGVDLSVFHSVPQEEARRSLGWSDGEKIVLFAGAFDNPVKNSPLAINAIKLLEGVNLLELKGFTRKEIALRMSAADALLMTSISEGSPQVIKEALACGCPIISVDVGDVKEVIGDTEDCYIVGRNEEIIARCLSYVIQAGKKSSNINRLETIGLSIDAVAEKIYAVYKHIAKY